MRMMLRDQNQLHYHVKLRYHVKLHYQKKMRMSQRLIQRHHFPMEMTRETSS